MSIPKTLPAMLQFMEGRHVDDCFLLMQRIRDLNEATRARSQDSIQKLVDIVKASEGLATRILRAAGVQSLHPDELNFAILKLGTQEVRDIALRHAYGSMAGSGDRYRTDLWNFNFCHALVADHCRKLLGLDGEVYLPALLERLGVIILHQYFAADYRAVREGRGAAESLYDRERAALGYTSIEVGAHTLELWGLGELAAPVEAQLTPASDLDRVRYFARFLAGRMAPVFADGVAYEPEVLEPLAQALGADFQSRAVEYLRMALRR